MDTNNQAANAKRLLDSDLTIANIGQYLIDQDFQFKLLGTHEYDYEPYYVFADGSVADEEFEHTWDNLSAYHDHLGDIAEAAHERMVSDFHAGDSGWPDPRPGMDEHDPRL
jgi:hypothetical protein